LSERRRTPRRDGDIILNLALQGGGAHGAFTWGVLDRLLEEPGITIGRISGASAGAFNGAALATGLALGGAQGAKEHLAALWTGVAQAGSLLTFMLLPLRKPGMGTWDDAMPLLSPYQSNPMGMEPLRQVLARVVDPVVLRRGGPDVFVNATHVQSGECRVFAPQDLSLEVLLASACAPGMFQAVEIDGDSYWDGSYTGNPLLWPLHDGQPDTDILLVELVPRRREETPTSIKNILNRINEVAAIHALVSELREVELLNRHAAGAVRMHVVSMDEGAHDAQLEPSIKRTVDLTLFEMLRAQGRQACEHWLAEHRGHLGVRASMDIDERYLRPYAQPARKPKS